MSRNYVYSITTSPIRPLGRITTLAQGPIQMSDLPSGTGTVTSVSVVSANGVSGTVSNPTTTPAITLSLGAITPTSIVASGSISGSNLSGTNTGDQTNITGNAGTVTTINGLVAAGSNVTLTGTGTSASPYTISVAAGSTGTVTSVSVASSNGFSGTVATPSTTPVLTLSTTITGLLQGVSGGLSSVIIGTGLSFSGGTLSSTVSPGTPTTRAINTTAPLVGGGDLSADRTLTISQASSTGNGYLSSTDWSTFNSKQSTLSLTTSGTSGAATLTGATLNIPQYSGAASITYVNLTKVDQAPPSGTYGTLSGSVNGSNTLFTVSNGAYSTGTLSVYLNGQYQTQGSSYDWTETSPSAGTFTFSVAPPTGSVITAEYITQSTSTGVSNPLAVLATVSGVNAKTVAGTLLYTVPTGKTLIVTSLFVRCTAVNSITSGPTCAVGTASGATDIYAASTIAALTATNKVFGFQTTGMSISVPAGGNVYFNVTGSATGTSQTLAADMEGYLI